MLDEALIEKLGSVVGRDNALAGGEALSRYCCDASLWRAIPDIVVRPRDAAEVAAVVALASENRIPVTPWGGGTGLNGGAVAARGGIVVSTERLNGDPVIHRDDLYAEVPAGVTNQRFQSLAESQGLLYPPDPSSWDRSTIGGNIAECARGLRSGKYGNTRRYVLGLEMVTPEGRVLFTGARTVKSVAGYDVTRMMVGSEGTLGIITSAVLGLLPRPQCRQALAAWFDSTGAALEASWRLAAGGAVPSTLEVMDAACTGAVSSYLREDLPGGALLLAEFDGMAAECDERARAEAEVLEGEYGARGGKRLGPGERDSLWRARRAVLPALAAVRRSLAVGDLTVPPSKLGAMAEETARIAARHDIAAALFGHAGNGNLHPALLVDGKDADEMDRAARAMSGIADACKSHDGTASAWRGIGLGRKPYLDLDIGQAGYEIMRSLKHSLDPAGIMNPGKMFYED